MLLRRDSLYNLPLRKLRSTYRLALRDTGQSNYVLAIIVLTQ
jgi:hypothetical protein